jgi:hypothetical protein
MPCPVSHTDVPPLRFAVAPNTPLVCMHHKRLSSSSWTSCTRRVYTAGMQAVLSLCCHRSRAPASTWLAPPPAAPSLLRCAIFTPPPPPPPHPPPAPRRRAGEAASVGLTEALQSLGLETDRQKTGTPARIDARSVDISVLEPQPGEEEVGRGGEG